MSVAATPALLDLESREWLRDLRAGGATADEAVSRLHALLLRAATFEVARRRPAMAHVRDVDDVAREAADDALISVRARLDDFRGDSRFTTWACKFALREAAVKLRRRAWQGRELPRQPEMLNVVAALASGPDAVLEQQELPATVQAAIERLTPHQRRVLVALTMNGVPIDVLAERLGTTRGAVYKTLHDGRRKLRAHVAACGLALSE